VEICIIASAVRYRSGRGKQKNPFNLYNLWQIKNKTPELSIQGFVSSYVVYRKRLIKCKGKNLVP
jgi:hypothetical protein